MKKKTYSLVLFEKESTENFRKALTETDQDIPDK
jgi:hypothetical protein